MTDQQKENDVKFMNATNEVASVFEKYGFRVHQYVSSVSHNQYKENPGDTKPCFYGNASFLVTAPEDSEKNTENVVL